MPKTDGLFPEPSPSHPDEQVAHEEIGRYYDDRVTEAEQALANAQAALAQRQAEQQAWVSRKEITPDVVGMTDMAPIVISSVSTSRYQQAVKPILDQMDTVGGRVVNRSADAGRLRAEAERLGEREKALRRWLTAQGHDLGAMAEPPPAGIGRRRS